MPVPGLNTFLHNSPDAISNLDTNFTRLVTYLNAREADSGLLANRPAFGNSGALYVATDVFGGTLYLDTGSFWIQIASGVLGAATSSVGVLMAAARGGGL